MPRLNRSQARIAIANREPFTSHTGNLSGEVNPGQWVYYGTLDEVEQDRLYADLRGPGIRYVVRSYSTPIGWETVDGTWYRVGQKFSQTTSCHQGMLPWSTVNA